MVNGGQGNMQEERQKKINLIDVRLNQEKNASTEEVVEISERLIKQNTEAYEELAK